MAAHLRALLVSTPAGRVEVIEADPCKPGTVLDDPLLADTLDLDAPVGLLAGSLDRVFDEAAHAVVGGLLGGLPVGSVVTVTHPTADFRPAVGRLVGVADRAGLVFPSLSR